MQSINIAFSTSNGLFSRIIRWFTRSEASHSLITFEDETLEKVFVMEANGRGFMLVPWAKWRKKNTLIARFGLDIPMGPQLESLRRLADLLGSEYDYVSLLGFALRRFRSRMSNPFDSSSKMICSEVVAKFLSGIGHPSLGGFEDAGSWVPEDLMKEASIRPVFVLEEGR